MRKLGGDSAAPECVWIDALVQARVLTTYQSDQLNEGRGDRLVVGQFVLLRPARGGEYAQSFHARKRDAAAPFRLWMVARRAGGEADDALVEDRLATLVDRWRQVASPGIAPLSEWGRHGDDAWIAGPDATGASLADWLARNGRLAPMAVLDIARQTTHALVRLHAADIVHGDIRAANLYVDHGGQTHLMAGGLRGAVRPREGYAQAHLAPEAYENLAPERVRDALPPTPAADVFACGCLWRHLLAARPVFQGATAPLRLRNAELCRLDDIRDLVPDVPEKLAVAIDACTRRSPMERPTMAELAALLGEPTPRGRAVVAAALHAPRSRLIVREPGNRVARQPPRYRKIAAVASALMLTAAVGTWPRIGGPLIARSSWTDSASSPRMATVASTPTNGAVSASQTIAPLDAPARRASSPEAPAGAAEFPVKQASASLPLDRASPSLDELSAWPTAPLTPGQAIGSSNQRAVVDVPSVGLLIDVDDVIVRNLDFAGPTATDDLAPTGPLLRIAARSVRFESCTFHVRDRGATAIEMLTPASAGVSVDAVFSDCVWSGAGSGLRCRPRDKLLLDLENCLFAATDAWVEVQGAPSPQRAAVIRLDHCTLRGAESLIRVNYATLPEELGPLTVQATGCVFAPRDAGGLLELVGDPHPGRLLAGVAWGGQGSILSGDAALALWRDAGGRPRAASGDAVTVTGLVRSPVVFAGPNAASGDDSRADRWQAPLHSADPPGLLGRLPSGPRTASQLE